MTSAWSITAAAKPPRAAFVDFPLGHTTGRPGHLGEQTALVRAALELFDRVDESGTIVTLPADWGSPWKNDAARLAGNATAREAEPQYQYDADRAEAVVRHGNDAACTACSPTAGPHD